MSAVWRRFAVFFLMLSLAAFAGNPVSPGDDLAAVFARAAEGKPLRCVAIGGSITQAGEGWIGPWLREQFPQSPIMMINAGMSATGSALGVFRLERDVIAFQPDLVLVEFCVNDGGLSDEDAVRYVESIVVRLKEIANPPAIVMVEAAARDGVNLRRHRRVARHYGLLEVDLQNAVSGELGSNDETWETLFIDDVHPNKAGHRFYARTIVGAFGPFLNRPVTRGKAVRPLPSALSGKPLLLDACMVNLAEVVSADGWNAKPSLPFWWDRFFRGVLVSTKPGAVLRVPVRGTRLGIMYPMHKEYGRFWASVDGTGPRDIPANSRDGYGFTILGNDLPAQEHLVEIATSSAEATAHLGYLLVAGQTTAARTSSIQGKMGAAVAAAQHFTAIPSGRWQWAGPFHPGDKGAADARGMIHHVLPPETSEPVEWQSLAGEADWINFGERVKSPAVVYASTEWEAADAGDVILALAADYYVKVWLNSELLITWDGPHDSPSEQRLIAAAAKAGKNRIVVKLGSGSKGFGFSLAIAGADAPANF